MDIKDDAGRLLHGSKLPEARTMGNHIERIPIRKLLDALRKRGVYTIARIVVFKDPKLFSFKNNKYSIRNWKTGKPWIGVPGERWTDGFSTFVHDYNLRVADEAEALCLFRDCLVNRVARSRFALRSGLVNHCG